MRPLILPLAILTIICGCSTGNNYDVKWTDEERAQLVTGLETTLNELMSLALSVEDSLWYQKPGPAKWSPAEIIEHIILQDQAYYREIKVVSALPQMPQYIQEVKENDKIFMDYATDPNKSTSDWDVTPTGRFCSKSDALSELNKVRQKITELVKGSNADFRRVFTFRNIPEEVMNKNPEFYGARKVRDLHQLVLNAIAHTSRHIAQFERTKDILTDPVSS